MDVSKKLQNSAGIIEPALTLEVAIFYLNDIADGSAIVNPYFTHFEANVVNIAGLSDAEHQALIDTARAATSGSVIPGYRNLYSCLV